MNDWIDLSAAPFRRDSLGVWMLDWSWDHPYCVFDWGDVHSLLIVRGSDQGLTGR